MDDEEPIFWPVARLVKAFRARELSPVELAQEALDRIAEFDLRLHSYLALTPELALEQARRAEALYRQGDRDLPAVLGIPVSIKDLFDICGAPTSLGSLVYRGTVAKDDSETVARLRAAGAVFLGKTNTAEFGQSATTENLLGPGCGNPWDAERTAGGSSGGAAAGVGAGLASVALGSDGGGSIRIPAAMCGLFGIKPTLDTSTSDSSFRAMTDFVCPGPLARSVADARSFLAVLLGRGLRSRRPDPRRIAWCAAPEGRPVDPGVRTATEGAVALLAQLGHRIDEVPLPIDGWMDAFGPLVLADEWRYRRHLLADGADGLTDYARKTIEAAERVTDEEIEAAHALKEEIRRRIVAVFEHYDFIVTPTTATVAFPIRERPTEIDGQNVGGLWGPFPFTAPFNVSGSPAASIPVGIADGMPVGLQVVGPAGGEEEILNLCEQLEAAISFPGGKMASRWRRLDDRTAPVDSATGRVRERDHIVIEHEQGVAIFRFNRPSKRNALTSSMLKRIRSALREEAETGADAVILTGGNEVFSAGMDLAEIGAGIDDLRVDDAIATATAAIRESAIPVVAAVEGPCFGAALDIAVACDARVAGLDASFSIPAARLGVLYRPDGIADLIATLGRDTVSRLLIFGERISAEEAVPAGLASHVVDRGGALTAALEVVQACADVSPRAVRATKQLINEVVGLSRPDLSSWEDVRTELLRSGARQQSVTRARARLGVATSGDRRD